MNGCRTKTKTPNPKTYPFFSLMSTFSIPITVLVSSSPCTGFRLNFGSLGSHSGNQPAHAFHILRATRVNHEPLIKPEALYGGFPKIRGTFFWWGPMIRIIVSGLYLVPLFWETRIKGLTRQSKTSRNLLTRKRSLFMTRLYHTPRPLHLALHVCRAESMEKAPCLPGPQKYVK